jgi:hypothetical protein
MSSADPEQPPRRRFLLLRILFFLLSLPLLSWALTQYGGRLWSYLQALPNLQGFWFWAWTIAIVWAAWSLWRGLRRKTQKAKQLAAEIKRR